MLTAEPIPLDIPPIGVALAGNRLVIDWRTNRQAVPFLWDGMYFDSFEQAMQHERYLHGRAGLQTSGEIAAKKESSRVESVERDQPAQPDQPYSLGGS